MKKSTLQALALGLGLVGAAGLLIATGCTKQQGPLSPSIASVGTSNSNATRLPKVQAFIPSTDPHQNVFIDFDSAMDPATFTSANVKVFSLHDVTGGSGTYDAETELTSLNISYDPASRRLTIMNSNGTWATNTTYRVLLNNGIHSLVGKPLDGNGNGIQESNEFDSYTKTFSIGTPTLTHSYNLSPLQLTSLTVDSNWAPGFDYKSGFTPGSSNANIGVANFITITATFTGGCLDTTSVNNNAGTMLTNADTGAIISPLNVIFWPAAGGNTFGAVYQLNPSSRYKIIVQGGLTGLVSTSDTMLAGAPLYNRYFDGNGNNVAEAKDNYVQYFTTAQQDNTAQPQLTVNTATYDSGTRKWTVLFNPTSGTDRLDATTLTNANFQLIVTGLGTNNSDTGISFPYAVTPKQIVFDGLWTVEVYVPSSFYPNDSNNMAMEITVLSGVKTINGVALDQDGPGPNNNYTSTTSDVSSK